MSTSSTSDRHIVIPVSRSPSTLISQSRSRWRSLLRWRSRSQSSSQLPPQSPSQAPSEPLSQAPLEPPSDGGEGSSSEPQPNLPRGDLLDGSRVDYIKNAIPLYRASMEGLWEDAKLIIDKQPEVVRFAITPNYETPLHIAASAKVTKQLEEFVKNLVKKMEKEDLLLQNKDYDTALCLAAQAGNVKVAKIMVAKNNALLEIPGSRDMIPLYKAVFIGQHDMVRYLYNTSNKMTGDFWTDERRDWVLRRCVEADVFDVAVQIVNDHPKLAINKDVLKGLAQKSDAFNYEDKPIGIIRSFIGGRGPAEKQPPQALQLLRIIWQKVLLLPQAEYDDIVGAPRYCDPLLFLAAEAGNTGFIVEVLRQSPFLAWTVHDKKTIFHIAVLNRY